MHSMLFILTCEAIADSRTHVMFIIMRDACETNNTTRDRESDEQMQSAMSFDDIAHAKLDALTRPSSADTQQVRRTRSARRSLTHDCWCCMT